MLFQPPAIEGQQARDPQQLQDRIELEDRELGDDGVVLVDTVHSNGRAGS